MRSHDQRGTPVVLDTDIGGDPDDSIALAAAARAVPELALVITNDETGGDVGHGQRARFARLLLDRLGRPDVAVVAGHGSGGTRYFCAGPLVPDTVPGQPTDVVSVVRGLLEASDGIVRWVGIGAFSNLARVIDEIPWAGRRLRVTQMGGALNYRDPSRAEHNIRMDVPAAHRVFRAVREGGLEDLHLITSDVTFSPEIEVTRQSRLYALLGEEATGWGGLLRDHLDLWFDSFHPGSMQHDALTLAAALRKTFVRLHLSTVELDELGRMSLSPTGADVWLSASAEYELCNRWLEKVLTSTTESTFRGDPPLSGIGERWT
ncbi:nucleoside hydrolase [Nocardiopsis aegyptia]|uniref:nucleoside hydrolase n=1 Tax=Nocardiopsis aegyptia TaxID=220378 RepID=UPI00366F0D5A